MRVAGCLVMRGLVDGGTDAVVDHDPPSPPVSSRTAAATSTVGAPVPGTCQVPAARAVFSFSGAERVPITVRRRAAPAG